MLLPWVWESEFPNILPTIKSRPITNLYFRKQENAFQGIGHFFSETVNLNFVFIKRFLKESLFYYWFLLGMIYEGEIRTLPHEDLHFNWYWQGHIECLEHFAFEKVGRRHYSRL